MAISSTTITPRQLVEKWATLPNKFEVNVFNFETRIGNAAKGVFQDSFYLRRFNSASAFAWAPRHDSKPHPLLEETGTLKRSIVWNRVSDTKSRGIRIFTDPGMFRSSKRQYGRNFCYAAIHNEGGSGVGATGFAARIQQRRFIGYSSVIMDKIASDSIHIFDGFPK